MILLGACHAASSKPTTTEVRAEVPTASPAAAPAFTTPSTTTHISQIYSYTLTLPEDWIILTSDSPTAQSLTSTLQSKGTAISFDAARIHQQGIARHELLAFLPNADQPTSPPIAQLTLSTVNAVGLHLTTFLTASTRELEDISQVAVISTTVTHSLTNDGQPAALIAYSIRNDDNHENSAATGYQATLHQPDGNHFIIITLTANPNSSRNWYAELERIVKGLRVH